ncbi:carbohydrate ABC transporter permease [Paenibacillus thalictri]|uniref:Carbohydrate ABC transporter permease n=1 Tax=Paenibacillus thalictri TaxID=2527873 RepID=A0A4Q9DPW4_9BACL|nr:carbohydrate ABC transporter permease [Paenibacillus thalictri]TBL76368.1 carbohydrate ABC transporter permease [Paenibacillus thalictri]
MVAGAGDRLFGGMVQACLILFGVVVLFPLLYVVAVSLTPYAEVLKNGGYVVIPRSITLAAYQEILMQSGIVRSLGITVFVTLTGTALNLLLTLLTAYPLSRKSLPGRHMFLMIIVFTLLFSGGIIPTYLVVKATGLIDSVWSLILPTAISGFNVLIVKSFFEQMPGELFEAARMDGAKEVRVLAQIVIPLSLPVIATVGLFYAVSHWNTYLPAIMYLTDRELYPLQVIIRELLMLSRQSNTNMEETIPTVTLQMSAVVAASAPIVAVYPFLQKHFTKGMMLGAIKG